MSLGNLFRLIQFVRLVRPKAPCPKCGAAMDLRATRGVCVRCRFPVAAAKARTWRIRRWTLTVICALCIPLYFVPFMMHADTQAQALSTLAIAVFSLCGFGALVSASTARTYRQMTGKP